VLNVTFIFPMGASNALTTFSGNAMGEKKCKEM